MPRRTLGRTGQRVSAIGPGGWDGIEASQCGSCGPPDARLQVDCVDLVQHHEVLRFEDPDHIFAEDGGKLKYIGITGHNDRDRQHGNSRPGDPHNGEFELFNTSSIYDGTAAHPEWAGKEPERVQAVMAQ
jgi:hypothetical protein